MALVTSRVGALTIARFPASWLRVVAPHGGATGVEVIGNPAVAAVGSGPMYSESTGRPLYRMIDRASGVDLASAYPARGGRIVVRNGVATADGPEDGAEVVVQGYPLLVRDGAPVGVLDDGTDSREALAVFTDGSLGIVTARATMPAFARDLAAAGATFAIYLDGGGSTTLRTRDGLTIGGTRRLPALVAAIPPATNGNGAAWAALSLAALAGAWWWSRRG